MVGVILDYNDIGICNNIIYVGLKLFFMFINSLYKLEIIFE